MKCKEIIFLTTILLYLLVTVATFKISLTQALLCPLKDAWINRIATSHSKMGVLLESMKVALSANKAVTYILVFKA